MVRPETSKCSRSSSRASYFNATTANFYSKQPSDPTQHEDQFNEGSNQPTNANNHQKGFKSKAMMSATLYDGKLKQKKTEESNWTINKPGIGKFDVKDGKRLMSASQGFKILKSDLKQGLSLDKIFGGEFKKVEISTHNLKEFEKPEARPKKSATGKRNQIQNADFFDNSYEIGRNATEDKFENNDDGDNINVHHEYNITSHGDVEKQARETATYFHSSKNTRGIENSDSNKFHREDARSNARETETRSYSVNTNKKAQEDAIVDKYQGSFYGKFNGARAEPADNYNRHTFYRNNNEKDNQFRISGTGFKKTFYQQGKKDEEFSGPKQSDRHTYGYDYYERERSYGTPSMVGPESIRMRDTATRFYAEKTDLQKGPSEINYIDRIEGREQDMLNKYANRRTPVPAYDEGIVFIIK